MNPQRALIEAAELARTYVYTMHMNLAGVMGHENTIIRPDLERIDAAISSAKAAEEGLETSYVVECERGGLTETWMRGDSKSAQECYREVVRDYPSANKIWLLRKDGYSKVISVREKEGL